MDLAATIGTNPWNERTKKQRRVVGSLTTAPAIKRLSGMIDLETSEMVKFILREGQGGSKQIMPHMHQKMLALNIVLMFCYGRRFSDVNDPLLLGILSDASIISRYAWPILFLVARYLLKTKASVPPTQMPKIISLILDTLPFYKTENEQH
jgi:hypothetical protein